MLIGISPEIKRWREWKCVYEYVYRAENIQKGNVQAEWIGLNWLLHKMRDV